MKNFYFYANTPPKSLEVLLFTRVWAWLGVAQTLHQHYTNTPPLGIGWGVGGEMVGSLCNTPPTESPVYKGLPRVLGGVLGCLKPYDDKSWVRVVQTFSRESWTLPVIKSGFTPTKVRLYTAVSPSSLSTKMKKRPLHHAEAPSLNLVILSIWCLYYSTTFPTT